MKQRNELILHLIGEVGHYILEGDPQRMSINLHLEQDGFHLTILDDIERSDEEIGAMEASLHHTERPELAGYYGSMAGLEMVGHARLNLVGWQIHHGDVQRVEGGTRIDLVLGAEGFDHAGSAFPGAGC
ncbi:MAG: hypothetical protein EA427_12010 [Spirochaetaceae bacterium]|nr:MAG: hypothetical protein EA427_12010 [Spirochaetaceae bacterium]